MIKKAVLSTLLSACWSSQSLASLPSSEELACPYDGTKFVFEGQMSGSSFDKTLDLMPVGALVSPWPIAECPTNGFVFYKQPFTSDELEQLRSFVLSDEYRALKTETTYYRAARLMERAGERHEKVSWALLAATWQVGRDVARYERYADELLARLEVDFARLGDEQKRTIGLLQGEIERQLGRFGDAKRRFRRMLTENQLSESEAAVARFELTLFDAGER